MGLEVYWTQSAEDELHRIFKHYLEKAGHSVAKRLAEGIYEEPFKLENHPEIGQIEELLKDRKQEFRYLVYKKKYKIIYWINRKETELKSLMFSMSGNIQ